MDRSARIELTPLPVAMLDLEVTPPEYARDSRCPMPSSAGSQVVSVLEVRGWW